MTIIGRIVDAVLVDPNRTNNGYSNPGVNYGYNNPDVNYGYGNPDAVGPRGMPVYYGRDVRYSRRDRRDMRRDARWDAILSPITRSRQQQGQPHVQQDTQYAPAQYSRQQESPYVPQQYGPVQQQQSRDVSREAPWQAPAPPPRRSSAYDVPAPEGPPPPYIQEEYVKQRRGEK